MHEYYMHINIMEKFITQLRHATHGERRNVTQRSIPVSANEPA